MGGWRSFVLSSLLVCVWAAAPAAAQDDGPAFLVISVSETNFDISELKAKGASAGSSTITVKIGTLSSGGEGPESTTFTVASISEIPLPAVDKYGNLLDPTTLGSHQATIFGSFEAYDAKDVLQPHVVTTTSTGIDPAIQAAVVAAAADLDTAIADDPFMTTGQIADIVHKKLPKTSKVTLDQVAAAIFDTDTTLGETTTTSGDPLVEAEGELFPHAPGSGGLFTFKFQVNEDGGYSSEFARIVEVQISENSVDLQKQGVLPVVVLSDAGFDAGDVAEVYLLGVAPESSSLSDQNSDGLSDLLVKFDVPKLVSAGLSTDTETVKLTGKLDDGTKIVGTSAINTK